MVTTVEDASVLGLRLRKREVPRPLLRVGGVLVTTVGMKPLLEVVRRRIGLQGAAVVGVVVVLVLIEGVT